MAGSNHLQLRDVNGKYFIQEMIEVAKTKGSGWVEYSWTNPLTKKLQTKVTYVKKVEGADVFIGCGVFRRTLCSPLPITTETERCSTRRQRKVSILPTSHGRDTGTFLRKQELDQETPARHFS